MLCTNMLNCYLDITITLKFVRSVSNADAVYMGIATGQLASGTSSTQVEPCAALGMHLPPLDFEGVKSPTKYKIANYMIDTQAPLSLESSKHISTIKLFTRH